MKVPSTPWKADTEPVDTEPDLGPVLPAWAWLLAILLGALLGILTAPYCYWGRC